MSEGKRRRACLHGLIAVCSFLSFGIQEVLSPLPQFATDHAYMVDAARHVAEGKGYVTYSLFQLPPADISEVSLYWNTGWAPLESYLWGGLARLFGHMGCAVMISYLLCAVLTWGIWGWFAGSLVSNWALSLPAAVFVPPFISHAFAPYHSTEMMALPLFVVWFAAAWKLGCFQPGARAFRWWALVTGLTAGVSYWARYSMVFLILANLLYLAYVQWRARRVDWLSSVLSVALSLGPILALYCVIRLHASSGGNATFLGAVKSPVSFARLLTPLPLVNLVFGPFGIRFLSDNLAHRFLFRFGWAPDSLFHVGLGVLAVLAVLAIAVACRKHRIADSHRRFWGILGITCFSLVATLMAVRVWKGLGGARLERYWCYVYPFLVVGYCCIQPGGRSLSARALKVFMFFGAAGLALMWARAHFYGIRNIAQSGLRVCNIVPRRFDPVFERIEEVVAAQSGPVVLFSMPSQLLVGSRYPLFPTPRPGFTCSKPTHVFVFGSPEAPVHYRMGTYRARMSGGYEYLRQVLHMDRIYKGEGTYEGVPVELWHGIAEPESIEERRAEWLQRKQGTWPDQEGEVDEKAFRGVGLSPVRPLTGRGATL